MTKKFLFGLKMAWDQELSSGLILLTFLTVLPFQFLSADTEQSWLFTLTFPPGRRSSGLRIRVVSRFDVPHVHHHLYLPFSLRDGPCQGTGGSFGFQEAATEVKGIDVAHVLHHTRLPVPLRRAEHYQHIQPSIVRVVVFSSTFHALRARNIFLSPFTNQVLAQLESLAKTPRIYVPVD